MLLWLQNLFGSSGPSTWPIAPNWLLSARARVYTLKANTMPQVGDWPPVDPPERIPLSIDFSPQLPTGDSLSATPTAPTATIAAYLGTDPNAAALLYGAAAISGTKVVQWVGPGWLPGVIYRVTMTAQTTSGATISLYAHIAAQAQN